MTIEEQRRCAACGAAVSAEAAFCVTCGAPQHHDRPATGVPWRARESFFVFLLHLFATILVAGLLAVVIADQDALDVSTILVIETALFASTVLWVRVRYGAGLRDLGLSVPTRADVLWGVGGALGGLMAAGLVALAAGEILEAVRGVPVEAPQQIDLQDRPEGAMLVLLGIAVVGFAPVAEEVFFRGMLFRGLRRWASPASAIVISSAVFGLVHVDPSGGQRLLDSLLVTVPAITVLGAVLAWLAWRRGRIAPAIITHVLFNALNFAVLAQSDRLS